MMTSTTTTIEDVKGIPENDISNIDHEQEQEVVKEVTKEDMSMWNMFVRWRNDSLKFKAFVLYLVIGCDALCFTIISPFLPEMIRERFGIESNVGTWVGAVTGGFVMARFFSSTYLGHLSDKYGRKWLLVWSLFASVIGTVLFGFMPTLFLAFFVRFVEGLVSATTVLSKTMIIDISNNENRAILIGYISAAFSISKSLSSAIGGVVVAVEKKRNSDNPYIAACVLGGVILIVALVGGLLLPETRKKRESANSANSQKKGLIAGIVAIYSDRLVAVLVTMFGIQSFCNGSSNVIYILLMEERKENNGLGFTALEIGIFFTIFGISCFLFNVFFFKKLIEKFGLYKVHMIGALFQTIQTLIFPLATVPYMINKNASFYWVYAICSVQVLVSTIGFMLLANTIQSMIVNVTDKSRQGLVQGTAQSVNNLARAIGPFVMGALFTLSIRTLKASYTTFLLSAVLYALAAVIGLLTFRTQRDIDLLDGKVTREELEVESGPEDEDVEVTVQVIESNEELLDKNELPHEPDIRE